MQTADQSVDEACKLVANYQKGKSALELLREERQSQFAR